MEGQRLDIVKVGEKFKGHRVKQIYYFDNDKDFIIFKNENNQVIFFAQKQISNISALIGQCNLMREIACSEDSKRWIDAQKAAALNEYFCDNEKKSKEILQECIAVSEKKEVARKKLFYIGTYLSIVLLLLIALLFVSFKGFNEDILKILKLIMFGAFGGFISLNSRLEKIEFNLNEGTLSYILVSIYKIAFSCVSSIIVYFLIDSDMILSPLKEVHGITYIAATLAGFSESLLPNIFCGIEKDIITKERERQ